MKNSRNPLLPSGAAVLVAAAVLVVFISGRPEVSTSGAAPRNAAKLSHPRFPSAPPLAIDGQPPMANAALMDDTAYQPPASHPGGNAEPTDHTIPQEIQEPPRESSTADLPSFSPDHPWQPVEPESPGNRLSFHGQLATVVAAQPLTGSTGVALAVMVRDSSLQTVAAGVNDFTAADSDIESETNAPESKTAPGRRGFTYEQQLFRTKWGWAAFDLMQKSLQTTQN